jgi:hypothetical protein
MTMLLAAAKINQPSIVPAFDQTRGDRGRTRNLCLLPRIDPTGFMRVKMNIALRNWTLSPVRLVLEDSSKRSFMLFVVVSLQLGHII